MSEATQTGNDRSSSGKGVCDVHRLVDKDAGEREVRYCGFCSSWICKDCWYDLPRRGKAWQLRRAELAREAFMKGLEGK